jgi:hypothetical protein
MPPIVELRLFADREVELDGMELGIIETPGEVPGLVEFWLIDGGAEGLCDMLLGFVEFAEVPPNVEFRLFADREVEIDGMELGIVETSGEVPGIVEFRVTADGALELDDVGIVELRFIADGVMGMEGTKTGMVVG